MQSLKIIFTNSNNFVKNDYLQNDFFKLSTFLDPRMGWKMFDEKKRVEIRERLKYHMCLIKPNKSYIKSNTDKNETNINSLYCTYVTSINSKTDLNINNNICEKQEKNVIDMR